MWSRSSARRLPSEATAPGGFEIVDSAGPARELVAAREPAGRRRVVFCEVTEPALVLGSTQPAEHADAVAARHLGVEVVRRASGGGAVFVAPGAQVWVDVFLPSGDPLLADDIAASFLWLGRAWAAALSSVGTDHLEVEPARSVRGPWARWLCFSSLGPGEVSRAGAKLVGISQRRTRAGAWFHSMAALRRSDDELLLCLALEPEERAECATLLRRVSAPLTVEGDVLRERLMAALSR